MKMERLYELRFVLFFYSLMIILFGSLIVPTKLFSEIVMPLMFVVNLSSGLIIFKNNKSESWLVRVMLVLVAGVFLIRVFSHVEHRILDYIRFFVYFIFYSLVTFQIISQIWSAKRVNQTLIYGLMSGYISLGLIGFFIFTLIELVHPGSFRGLGHMGMTPENIDDLMYFSYVTLLTIGYGDIIPLSNIAQKAAMFIGIIGQFYLVIITAVVVEKYIRDSQKE